jgi:hypothetical protein
MNPKTFFTILLFAASCFGLRASAQSTDSIAPKKDYGYGMLTLFTGIGILPTGSNNGTMNVSFPYSVDGSPSVPFNSAGIQPYAHSKLFLLPVAFEAGGLHDFFKIGFSFSDIGGSIAGENIFLGYGHNFYLGFKSSQSPEDKALVIKPSLSFSYSRYDGGNSNAHLGSIDNTGHSIDVLGHTAGQTFDVQNPADPNDPGSVATTTTEGATSLDFAYVQREWALLPQLSITSNQYKKGPHWEFTVGYNLPIGEQGGIAINQSGDGGDNNTVAGLVDLNHEGIETSYNGRPVSSAPFHFSGLFWNISLSFPLGKDKNQ